MFLKLYNKLVSDYHKFTLLLISIILIISFYFAKNFNLDASSDALLLEGDKDLKYLREVNNRYGSKDFLFLTYSPITDFTDEDTIINIQLLKSKIEKHNYQPPKRKRTYPPKKAIENRLEIKKNNSEKKNSRKKINPKDY